MAKPQNKCITCPAKFHDDLWRMSKLNVETFKEFNINIRNIYETHNPFLLMAISNYNIGLVKELLKYADVNLKDSNGDTPLKHAFESNTCEEIRMLLLDAGANVNVVIRNLPLVVYLCKYPWLLGQNYVQNIIKIINKTDDITNEKIGYAALHMAFQFSNVMKLMPVIKHLISLGVDIHKKINGKSIYSTLKYDKFIKEIDNYLHAKKICTIIHHTNNMFENDDVVKDLFSRILELNFPRSPAPDPDHNPNSTPNHNRSNFFTKRVRQPTNLGINFG